MEIFLWNRLRHLPADRVCLLNVSIAGSYRRYRHLLSACLEMFISEDLASAFKVETLFIVNVVKHARDQITQCYSGQVWSQLLHAVQDLCIPVMRSDRS